MSSDKTCFGKFFQHMDIQGLLDRFTIYHIDAPGQVSTLVFVYFGFKFKSAVPNSLYWQLLNASFFILFCFKN